MHVGSRLNHNAMNVIITCFQSGESLLPLTRDLPVAMLPVLNRPIIQHHIEMFVELGCTRFLAAAVENPLPLEEFLGHGSRWGATIELLVLKEVPGRSEIVDRIASRMAGETAIVVPAETLLDLDFEDLLKFHEPQPGSCTRILADHLLKVHEESSETGPRFKELTDEKPLDSGIFVINGESSAADACVDYTARGAFLRIVDSRTFWAANMAALDGRFPRLVKKRASGGDGDVWAGHHVQIARDAVVTGPVLLGDYVKVHTGGTVQSWSVLGDGVIIDKGALVRSSVVTDRTYVGEDTSVENAIASGRLIQNITLGHWVEVMDPFLLSATTEKILIPQLGSLLERGIACALLGLTAPIWILAGGFRRIRGKGFFKVHDFFVTEETIPLRLRQSGNKVKVFGFGRWNTLAGRLPALMAVIKGQLRLVGVRPLENAGLSLYKEDWAQLRGHAPTGLFTPVDAEGLESATEEEKIVVENYYAVTRSFAVDAKIFLRSLLKLLRSPW